MIQIKIFIIEVISGIRFRTQGGRGGACRCSKPGNGLGVTAAEPWGQGTRLWEGEWNPVLSRDTSRRSASVGLWQDAGVCDV
jgi:hypothetical protein